MDLVALQQQLNAVMNNLNQVHVAKYENIVPMCIAMRSLEDIRSEIIVALRATHRRAMEEQEQQEPVEKERVEE